MPSATERDSLTDIQDRLAAPDVERQKPEDSRDLTGLRSLKAKMDQMEAEHADLRQHV